MVADLSRSDREWAMDCKVHGEGTCTKKMMIPLQKMGRPKGFEPFVLPCCAGKYLWSSTKKIITSPFTRAALSSQLPIRSGGLLVQPMYWTEAVNTMRHELKRVGMNPLEKKTGPMRGGARRK